MSVLLKKTPFGAVSSKELAEQIEAKKKCKDKLPSWYKTQKIYYPNKLNIEQCSSEITARYKAQIVSGKSLIDLTGGLGVDSYYFSKKIEQLLQCEINENLSKIAAHNFDVLGAKNITVIPLDGITFLQQADKKYDWLYIDPSRRSESKEKVFLFTECTPNIVTHLDLLLKKSKNVLLKTSPLFDISKGLRQLKHVKEVHVVAVKNEVKELLWILQEGYINEVKVKTINIKKEKEETFDFTWSAEKRTSLTLGEPQNFLYEPNAAILKAGAFKLIAEYFNINKLGEHSHLYTSQILIEFPGRAFKIEKVYDYTKKELKTLSGTKANITIRNFPVSVAAIRKKHNIKDGGSKYLFFTKLADNRPIVICGTKGN